MRALASLTRSVPLFMTVMVGESLMMQTRGRSADVDAQLAAVGVELGASAEGYRPLIGDVAERNAGDRRDAGHGRRLTEHDVETVRGGVVAVAHFGKMPEGDAGE